MKNISDKNREYRPTTNKKVKLTIGAELPRYRRHRPLYLLSHYPRRYQWTDSATTADRAPTVNVYCLLMC